MNTKAISSLVTPSVVSIAVTTSSGGGTGSGSIYKSNGSTSFIVTNNHVVEGAASSGTITIELVDGNQYRGTIVGRDANYDLAVVKISAGNLPTIALGLHKDQCRRIRPSDWLSTRFSKYRYQWYHFLK